jgi:hypothetical protein
MSEMSPNMGDFTTNIATKKRRRQQSMAQLSNSEVVQMTLEKGIKVLF